jgi:hypothetical protein
MMRIRFTLALLPLAMLVACGGADEPDPQDSDARNEGPANMAEAIQAANEALGAMRDAQGTTSPTFTPEELRDRMPESVAGLERVDLEVTSGGLGGMTATTVNARYENDEGHHIAISLIDMTAVPAMAAAAGAWSLMSYDRTTTNGFERTTRIDGLPAMESQKLESGYVQSELNVLAGAYTLHLTSRGVDVETLREIARELGMTELAG